MNTDMDTKTFTVKLPRKHAADWFDRLGDVGDNLATLDAETDRTVIYTLNDAALRDLIADATYYAQEMDPQNSGDIDYRPAARRCLAALERAGFGWTRNGFRITITRKPE